MDPSTDAEEDDPLIVFPPTPDDHWLQRQPWQLRPDTVSDPFEAPCESVLCVHDAPVIEIKASTDPDDPPDVTNTGTDSAGDGEDASQQSASDQVADGDNVVHIARDSLGYRAPRREALNPDSSSPSLFELTEPLRQGNPADAPRLARELVTRLIGDLVEADGRLDLSAADLADLSAVALHTSPGDPWSLLPSQIELGRLLLGASGDLRLAENRDLAKVIAAALQAAGPADGPRLARELVVRLGGTVGPDGRLDLSGADLGGLSAVGGDRDRSQSVPGRVVLGQVLLDASGELRLAEHAGLAMSVAAALRAASGDRQALARELVVRLGGMVGPDSRLDLSAADLTGLSAVAAKLYGPAATTLGQELLAAAGELRLAEHIGLTMSVADALRVAEGDKQALARELVVRLGGTVGLDGRLDLGSADLAGLNAISQGFDGQLGGQTALAEVLLEARGDLLLEQNLYLTTALAKLAEQRYAAGIPASTVIAAIGDRVSDGDLAQLSRSLSGSSLTLVAHLHRVMRTREGSVIQLPAPSGRQIPASYLLRLLDLAGPESPMAVSFVSFVQPHGAKQTDADLLEPLDLASPLGKLRAAGRVHDFLTEIELIKAEPARAKALLARFDALTEAMLSGQPREQLVQEARAVYRELDGQAGLSGKSLSEDVFWALCRQALLAQAGRSAAQRSQALAAYDQISPYTAEALGQVTFAWGIM